MQLLCETETPGAQLLAKDAKAAQFARSTTQLTTQLCHAVPVHVHRARRMLYSYTALAS